MYVLLTTYPLSSLTIKPKKLDTALTDIYWHIVTTLETLYFNYFVVPVCIIPAKNNERENSRGCQIQQVFSLIYYLGFYKIGGYL